MLADRNCRRSSHGSHSAVAAILRDSVIAAPKIVEPGNEQVAGPSMKRVPILAPACYVAGGGTGSLAIGACTIHYARPAERGDR